MLESIYLPEEELTYVNFPVLREERQSVEDITAYALRAYTALSDYNEALYDRVDINTAELEQYITLCRDTCSRLASADSIPFDLLLELRSILTMLYKLRTLAADSSANVIGEPAAISTEDDGL
ncbi:hypothetical protein G9G53_22725 [Paenibacillus sp. EKM206P]|uniref:hypothetical protein n=1 Tax=Paenibacillus sp. EKM206P TaxID=1683674 RepID=UPI0013EDA022|nr:hypothetical protein [Paenibacillus sp. EKM206P]KAF6569106.1 hypothetical protein G9G53_22725 [Paenibacillus sp. EKM206P]